MIAGISPTAGKALTGAWRAAQKQPAGAAQASEVKCASGTLRENFAKKVLTSSMENVTGERTAR